MRERVDRLVAARSDHPAHTGLVVAALDGEKGEVHGYGSVAGSPPSGKTQFEIGSVTKVFTTALLSLLVAEGQVALDDPVGVLSSELQRFPRQVTLRRLATHTAGLPKMPGNILGSMLRDRRNPYAAYSADDLLKWLSRRPPSISQLEVSLVKYSNLGFALLGRLLAQRLGESYETAVRSRICEPLGMQDTCIQLSDEQRDRLALPHGARGKPVHSWDLPAFAGAGALRSTANDLLKFLAAQLGQASAGLTGALQASHEVQERRFAPAGLLQRLLLRLSGDDRLDDRRQEGIALGWSVGRLRAGNQLMHWHHGATGGYRAFVGFVRSRAVGVVVLANSGLSMRDGILGTTATDRLGFELLEQLSAGS